MSLRDARQLAVALYLREYPPDARGRHGPPLWCELRGGIAALYGRAGIVSGELSGGEIKGYRGIAKMFAVPLLFEAVDYKNPYDSAVAVYFAIFC